MNSVGVIGAGIIGVTTALELRDRGFEVILIDRKPPGGETSYGNAGVLTGSTVLNVNNPGIWRQLPRLLCNRSSYFRYDAKFVRSHWRWLLAFLAFSTPKYVLPAARALRDLQLVSIAKHRTLIARAGAGRLLNTNGWLKVFRSAKGFDTSRRECALMRSLDIQFSVLSKRAVAELEPSLKSIFEFGLLMHDSCSIRDPFALTKAYVSLYENAGGDFVRDSVTGISRQNGKAWSLQLAGSDRVEVDQVVIAAGPWSPDVCAMLGYAIPMAWERGYHTHLESPEPALTRPIFDVEAGVVMSPQASSVRISSGVELNHRDAQPNYALIRQAVLAARTAADFGNELDDMPWLGSRPTLPDSLPMIGAATRHGGLWFNFGHQHIGLSTSAASAELLADQIEGRQHAVIKGEPFIPCRFSI